jgi:thiamine kinase-like enzyme
VTAAGPSLPFTSADAFTALEEACSQAGLHGEGAQLLRLGENAIFRLAREPIVVRIGRSADVLTDAQKEVAVALWLRDAGLPAAETTEHAQPIMVQDHPVTFWEFIEDSGTRATIGDLASILRDLHKLSVPADLPLPELDIFDRVAARITKSHDLSEMEREFLTQHLQRLMNEYRSLDFALPRSAVHGDAHQSNLIRRPDGKVVVIDFERFALGPPESDLAVTATEYLIGWHSDADYAEFCSVYGFDIMDWAGFPVIRSINELKMTTWLMQNVRESDQVAEEFRRRLASLRDADAPRDWRPF